MSEGDVSLIHDEDVLRRMWQQTEDFSRKKEIRAHMYRLREERLRSLYSPEPTKEKGCESMSGAPGGRHGHSFADQSFQSIKSKEVRDAASPPKEFLYRGQDLKELSNAGWNVESENKTTDDGHTRVKSIHANIEGRYDVEGGRGQFAAVDRHRQAATEYRDDHSSLRRDETSSDTAAHEHVVRQTADGTHVSSEKTSSSSSSKIEQLSSTTHETVPYVTNVESDRSRQNYDAGDVDVHTRREILKTNERQQVLRSQCDGELVSRKIDYPDSNTKVIVETRELPDGTRVTSTRREFRAPAVSTSSVSSEQHSQQTRSENKTTFSSTQQRSNTRESSKTREAIDDRIDHIVDSQKIVDDYDFKKNYSTTQKSQKSEQFETNKYETNQRYESKVDEINKQKTTASEDTRTERDDKTIENKTQKLDLGGEERVHHITRNNTTERVEKVVERKTSSEQYQTTYQTDFPQKKISQDLSPTHQAWASTLRADTPTSSRPTTRASSPGSRTFQSSTSSLRSSVSPDKTYRKPSSRGGSPNKFDRSSPSRNISDRYSSTHSTRSVSETKTSTHASQDGKFSHGSSPGRSSISPDRKRADGYRQRPSVSPEKRPFDSSPRTSASPDRKPGFRSSPTDSTHKSTSPTRPFNKETSPTKSYRSPDRQPSDDKYSTSTQRLSTSPDRKTSQKSHSIPNRSSISPDRKPGYMRPTASTGTGVEEDHYKFIDEETKMYTRTDKTSKQVLTSPEKHSVFHDRSPSPVRKHPSVAPDDCRAQSPSILSRPSLRKESRSPSPPKGPVTFSQDNKCYDTFIKPTRRDTPNREPSPTKYETYEKQIRRSEESENKTTTSTTNKYDSLTRTEKSTKDKHTSQNRNEVSRKSPSSNKGESPVREPSPSKYGTYDKKEYKYEDTDKNTKLTKTEIRNINDDATTRRDSTSPKKTSEIPTSPTKKDRRDSTSPLKSPAKDHKYKYTTDFIATEKTTEEINKKTARDHPRQLITPSTSPTRKPKVVEQEPSTGQSSPTTSVSGFVYFSSPPLQKTIVTDLDDGEFYYVTDNTEQTLTTNTTTTKRPDNLHLNRSPSPTKIPCRSPSPEKRVSPTKEVLPRKSSLKKPSTVVNQVSPTEKPPSTFRVSPTAENNDFPEHKIVKKDRPDKPDIASPVKVKPPFERRETYEERCRKILGMMEDTNKTTSNITATKEITSYLKEPQTNGSSPSVSPCVSPAPKESSPIREQKPTNGSKFHANDFISHEKDTCRTPNRSFIPKTDKTTKTPSRESSPTKLQDIISTKNVTTNTDVLTETKHEDFNITETKYKSPRSSISPTRFTKAPDRPNHASSRTESPTKKPQEHSRTPSPTKKLTETSTKFITLEKEQEVLDRVQKSLRNLSPDRSERSPSREKSPGKSMTSLLDIDITSKTTESIISEKDTVAQGDTKATHKIIYKKPEADNKPQPADDTPKGKVCNKPSSRNTSPVKKPFSTPVSPKSEKVESPVKARSTSPRKPVSQLTRKPTPTTIHVKSDTTITTDHKKTTGVAKTLNKTTPAKINRTIPSPTRINESDNKRPVTYKGGLNKENVSPKKEDTRVIRTASDISIKTKKPTPQRVKSKPEIQVSDLSTIKTSKQTSTIKTTNTLKSTIREPIKLAPKPKSATALNTTTDDDDILIDVEQAKSSRENSPDRICPTPISFMEDVGTPRLPDEVSEPDDDFRKRTHHTIHETESLVDDIIEISEDDELFVKKTNIDNISESDECLLSVNDKVSKFTNKIETVTKPKDTTKYFKDTERRVHSDFVEENLKSDECLLSVSEKVNKFAKGPRDTKDSRSPSRRVTDEYDINTVYQDDYTKLSVNDKAHLFVETAENSKTTKQKPAQKKERPDLKDVDESLRSDDCLLSVSDKVNKFVKTAEQFLNESHDTEEKERKIKEQHEEIMRKIVENLDDETNVKNTEINVKEIEKSESKSSARDQRQGSFSKETTSSHAKNKDYASPNLKPIERIPAVKITTLRSSEAVKKAKALFENIATTQKNNDINDSKLSIKTAKLTDIGVIKKSPKTDSTIVLHPSLEDGFPADADEDISLIQDIPDCKDRPSSGSLSRPHRPAQITEEKPRDISTRLTPLSQTQRTKSPLRQSAESTKPQKTVLSRYPISQKESPKFTHPEAEIPEKPQERVPGYQRPTMTSQIREEVKTEELEVSSRRGSGKFGVELRRTSLERSSASSERRRSSLDHHQPCIEDIFDIDLLEQMLEKVVGYEQRRRIRAQIRVAKKRIETEHVTDTNTITKTTKHAFVSTPKNRSPERHLTTKSSEEHSRVRSPVRHPKSTPVKTSSPERHVKTVPQKTMSPDRTHIKEQNKPILNGHVQEPTKVLQDKRQRPQSPEKHAPKSTPTKTRSPIRQKSPEKKTRPLSPTKTTPAKPKANRFNEYASAYMKKVGMSETERLKLSENKTKKSHELDDHKTIQHNVNKHVESKVISSTKTFTERSSSKDTFEVKHVNGKRSPSPEKRIPERRSASPIERMHQRSPTPDWKGLKAESGKKETIIKTTVEVDRKVKQEEKPSWVTNRNLKKTTESRTFSNKRVESEKRQRAASPSKVISKPLDVITSSYGPGPLDADGRPLFGIKALRNGATNYQVKGTVVRQEFHSRNGGEPEGSVSVTAYSTDPEELERLLRDQGERPSRLHGLAAITTTKKFGGDTGTTYKEVHTKEERASLEQFTHSDRRSSKSDHRSEVSITDVTETKGSDSIASTEKITDKAQRVVKGAEKTQRTERMEKERREDRKTVRQSSVKSLTEKYIKSASDTSKSERSSYPKAGLILRSAGAGAARDSLSSDSDQHAGLARTDSEHSLGSVEDTVVTTTERVGDGMRTTTTTTRTHGSTRSHGGTTVKTQGVTTRTQGVSVRQGQEKLQERSFLDSTTKVSGVQDILTRMKNADIVIEDGDSCEDTEARALLNKFLGATVLMAGMQSYVTEKPAGKVQIKQVQEVRSAPASQREFDPDQCWDERELRKRLEECTDYEQRRRLRARIRSLMAEQEACASAVTEALAAASPAATDGNEAREEEEVTTVTSSVRRNSSEKTVSSSTTTKTSKVIESMTRAGPKPVSPFAKFRQLEKQNSTSSPNHICGYE